MSQQNGSSSGIGVFGLLGVLFVALKLLGFIDWSWWLVLLPFYGGFVLILFIAFIFILLTKDDKR